MSTSMGMPRILDCSQANVGGGAPYRLLYRLLSLARSLCSPRKKSMSLKSLALLVIASVIALGAAHWRQTPAQQTPPKEKGVAIAGAAVRITLTKDSGLFLERPEIKYLGDQAFLVGDKITSGEPSRMWVRLDTVVLVEEFTDFKAMAKEYNLSREPTAKGP